MTSRHWAFTVVGFTHASSVIALVSRSDAVLGILTSAFVPLKTSAPPSRPAGVQLAFLIFPSLLPLDASWATLPAPSSNEYAATRPWPGCGAGEGDGDTTLAIAVTSLAELFAVLLSPPPLTVAVLVTEDGADVETFTVTVTVG